MTTPSPAASTAAELRAKERRENFPVAMRMLPSAYQRDLRAVYDLVRVIDDLGDLADGDRSAQLLDFRADLQRIWSGEEPQQPAAQRLAPVVSARGLSEEPFDRLVEANLMDQTVTAYQTFDEVLGYCALSAAPIGRMVLEVFGQSTPERQQLSDHVCMALQLLEHWQDVGEDRRAGRTYLPQEDLLRFAVPATDLEATTTSTALRRLLRVETDRAAALLDAGPPLVGSLHGWARLAVAGYLAGGRATVEALRRADFDVMTGPPRPRRSDIVRHAVAALGRSLR